MDWNAGEYSDLDLVAFGCTSREIYNLRGALQESDLLMSVDVMNWETIPEDFKENIKAKYAVVQKTAGLEGWQEVKLGEISKLNYGKPLLEQVRVAGDVPVYSSAGLIGWHNKALVDSRGIIIGRKGTAGSVHKSQKAFFPIDTTFYISKNDTNCDLDYLFYRLSTLNLEKLNSDSAVPGLNRDTAYAQQFLLPSLPEQKTIAEVLSSLDDKIDLLHRQNKTLEDLAQAKFRQWFVEKPKGNWKQKSLDEIADYLNGLACQKYPPKNDTDKLPVLKIRELNNGITEGSDWATSQIDKKYIVERGDVIFSWSGSLMVKIWDGQNCVLNQHLFKITSDRYPKWFYYLWTKHHLEKFISVANSKATTMGHIKRNELSVATTLVPPDNELHKMNESMETVFEKIVSNAKKLYALQNTRDTLLPKLMNGEARVAPSNSYR